MTSPADQLWLAWAGLVWPPVFNTLRPRQNGRHFPDDIFKCIFLNENVLISIKISLKFVPKVPINNIPTLVPIMAWRRPGDKPLSEAMMGSLLTHICVTRPQRINMPLLLKYLNLQVIISIKIRSFASISCKKRYFETWKLIWYICDKFIQKPLSAQIKSVFL